MIPDPLLSKTLRPRRTRRWLILAGLALLNAPACLSLDSRTYYSGIYLAAPESMQESSDCQAPQESSAYYFFFGTLRINRPEADMLFPEPGRYVYLMEQYKSGTDWAVSILMGTLFSITRNSLRVTPCRIAGDAEIGRLLRLPPRASVVKEDASESGEEMSEETRQRIQERIEAARRRAEEARERAEEMP